MQALGAGRAIRDIMDAGGSPYNLFFYTSPYKRSRQTYEEIIKAIEPRSIMGAQEEVQLREQDFGNFQVRGPPPDWALEQCFATWSESRSSNRLNSSGSRSRDG